MRKQSRLITSVTILLILFCFIGGLGWSILGQQTQRNGYHHTSIPLIYSQAFNSVGKMGDGDVEKWAVIIAVGGGVGYAPHERADRNDVRKLTKVLLEYGWDSDHLFVLLEEQATTEAIMNDSFSWLRSQGEEEDDLILYFFSGHGYYHTSDEPPIDEPDGKDELIHPWDPDMAGWNPNVFILDDSLAARFDTLKSKNIVIIMATCHAGGMIDGSQDLCGSGRIVLTSCDVDEASWRMNIPYDWIFPYYCIKGMQGRADKNNDKFISAEEMFEYTVEPVQFRAYLLNFFHPRYISGISQHPQMYDGWPTEGDNADELILVELGGK